MNESMERNMEEQEHTEASEPLFVRSHLENLNGQQAEIRITREADGRVPAVAFFDIDLTFLSLEEVLYPDVRRKLWPNIDPDKVDEIHLAGFRLGTMFKEMYRMKMLNDHPGDEKYSKWVDANAYKREFLEGDGQHINEPGDQFHDIADAELRRFDGVATKVAQESWSKHPESYERAQIGPVFQLAEQYRRLGIPMVGMTANPRRFIEEILKYTGLADKFIECATDYDVPGDKEHKMKWLVEQLERDGIPVSYDQLVVIGDSPTGDVGSGPRFEALMAKEHPELKVSTQGLLVAESEDALMKARAELASKPELAQQLVGKAQAFRWDKVKKSPYGTFDMTQKNRKEFLEPLVVE